MSSDSDDSFFGEEKEETEKAESCDKANEDAGPEVVKTVEDNDAEEEEKRSSEENSEEEKRYSEGEETDANESEGGNIEEEVYEEEEFDEDSEERGKEDDGENEGERSSKCDDMQRKGENESDDKKSSEEEDGSEEGSVEGDKYDDNDNRGESDEKESMDGKTNQSDRNEELENLFDSSSSTSSSPSKNNNNFRGRPSSAKNQMRVLITASKQRSVSPCSSEDSCKAVILDNHDNKRHQIRASNSNHNLQPGRHYTTPSGNPPPPLLVTKSPVHTRPTSARRSRDSSPRSWCSEISSRALSTGDGPETGISERSREGVVSPLGNREAGTSGLSNKTSGINRVLSSKEQQSSKGDVMPTKPRPKSAITQPKIMGRGPSVTGNRILPRNRPLGDYSRSLQMLGVKVPAPAPKAPKTPRSSSSQSWQSEGKLHTRVTKRSTSLEDVTHAIPQVKEPETLIDLKVDEAQRATLSQAIYEEWYFRRCKQIRSKRIKSKRKLQEEQRKKEAIEQEKEGKVGLAVEEWKEKKMEQKKKAKEKVKEEESKKTDEVKEKDEQQMKVTAAVIAWETEKIELAKKKRERKRQEREIVREKEMEKIQKREEAEMIFQSWMEQKKHREKEKRRKLKEEEEERKRKEEEALQEKREIADLAFNAWKKKKRYEEGENLRKVYIKSETLAAEDSRKRLHRSSEALHAYDTWLDGVEERELIRSYSNTRVTVLQADRPPWWPGGTHNSLMGSC